MSDDYRWPGDNATQIERGMSAEYELLDKAVSEINALRAQLAMRNSDVQELVRVLRKTVEFYDRLNATHHSGEAALLDELAATLAALPPQDGA